MTDRYLQAAEQVLKAAAAKKDRYAGACHECRYHRAALFGLDDAVCVNPVVQLVGFNTTRAYDRERIVTCDAQRDVSSPYGSIVCGPDGALFEQRDPSFFGVIAKLFNGGFND